MLSRVSAPDTQTTQTKSDIFYFNSLITHPMEVLFHCGRGKSELSDPIDWKWLYISLGTIINTTATIYFVASRSFFCCCCRQCC